jgi:tRNA nucleotidyltransferase/poly(A) polymerase
MGLKETLKIIQETSNLYLINKPYIVGGLPRDLYLGIPNVKTTDIDITTNSPEVLRLGILVADKLNVTFELADDGHLTVFSDKFDLDFSSHFISDDVKEYLNGEFEGLEEAFSRDFTINTLHQDLVTGEILDPTKLGFKDIDKKLIKTPVPAEITLTDDPRRIYRAINLAVRYQFNIDDEIKSFVIENPHLFKADKIKDKYVAVKINKSLDINPNLTIQLLKEFNLFNNVPLSGKFKDILIKEKLLVDYLDNKNLKTAQIRLAKNWNEYIEQGPEYLELKTWWQNNAKNLPGNYNPSYLSWEKWYMKHYREQWNLKHKSPNETLLFLQDELNGSGIINQQDPFGLLNMEHVKKDFELGIENVIIKPGVNVENVSSDVKYFIKILGEEALKLKLETPVITSGWRSVEEQAKIMATNWFNNGGQRNGKRYLIGLYGKDYGGKIAAIFEKYGNGEEGQRLAIQVIKNQPVGSSHIMNPGTAIDLRMTSGIDKILKSIVSQKIFDLKIKDETNYAGPHYHVNVKGIKNRKNSIMQRKEAVLKIINY